LHSFLSPGLKSVSQTLGYKWNTWNLIKGRFWCGNPENSALQQTCRGKMQLVWTSIKGLDVIPNYRWFSLKLSVGKLLE
jgi:hypothetical protein